MKWFLVGIGVFWIMAGTLMLFATQVAREHYLNKLRTKDSRRWSPLPIILGVLLLLSASSSSQVTFIVILGLLSLAKGLLLLFVPRERLLKMTDWWFEASDRTYKALGAMIIVLGIAVLAGLVR